MRVIRTARYKSKVGSDPQLRRMPRGEVVHVALGGGSSAVCGEFGTTEQDNGGRICQKCDRWLRSGTPRLRVIEIEE